MSRALSVLLSMFTLAPVAAVLAQDASGTPPAAPAADGLPRVPRLTLPNGTDVKLPVPRTVRAAEAFIGMSRQRLALVVGIGRYGMEPALASAQRDAQAVASALRGAGFIVMAREDLGPDALRADLAEFRQRLQPGGIGFVYVGSLGTQLEGRNLLLTRASRLEADAPRTLEGLLPLQEVVDAVQGTAENPRYLVVDAAYAHPALVQRAPAPFAEPKIPPGVMALFAATPGSTLDVPALEAVAADAPPLAASRFAKAVVAALNTRHLSGAATLRAVRSRVLDESQGKQAPWIAGDSSDKDDLAVPDLLEAVMPRSPEEMAREAMRQIGRRGDPPAPAPPPAPGAPDDGTQPNPGGPTKLIQAAATTAGAIGTIGNVAAGAASVAGTAAAMKTTQAVAAAEAVGTAAGAAAQVVGATAQMAGGVAQAAIAAATPTATSAASVTANTAASTTAARAAAATSPAVTAGGAPPSQVANAAPTTPAPRPAPRIDPGGDRPVSDFLPPPPPPAPPAPAPAALPAAAERAAVPADFNGRNPPATPLPQAPKRNAYGYAQGDSFTYRTIDVWKDNRVTGSFTQRIDNVFDDGALSVNQAEQRLDAQGRTIRRRNPDGTHSSFDPVQEFWWSNPKRGESRDVRFDEKVERGGGRSSLVEWKGSMEVGRPRRIQLPAGEFEVLPIEGSGWLYERGVGSGPMPSRRWFRTVWYSPQLGHPVAIDIEETDALNKLLRRERVELTHAETSRNR